MHKKQLFFDLDRTLWDFEANSRKALDILYHDLGVDKLTTHFIQFHETYKSVNHELWELYAKNKISKEQLRNQRFIQTFERLGIDEPVLAAEMGDGYIEISPEQTLLFPNTKEILTELKQAGFQMNIITNGFEEVQYRKLKNCDLTQFFDHVICSEAVGYSKPDKRVYDYALDQSKSKREHSVMIGDDMKADVLGSEAAGLTGVLFDPGIKKLYASEIHRIKNLSELPMLLLKL